MSKITINIFIIMALLVVIALVTVFAYKKIMGKLDMAIAELDKENKKIEIKMK